MSETQIVDSVETFEAALARVREAQRRFAAYTQEQVDRIFQAAAVAAMSEAIGTVRTSEVTYAARDSDFGGFDIKAGDYMALAEGQLFGTDTDLNHLMERLAQDPSQQEAEFINIFYGEDVSEEAAQEVEAIFTASCPNAEINLISGGQPVYYYMITAE